MKITLILSTNKSYSDAVLRGKPYTTYAPLTLLQLAALVPPRLNAKIELIDLMREKLPDQLDCDLLGISTITCGAMQAYRIADKARQSGITVVLGGSHPTALPQEALQHADAVVTGFAEKSWPQLLEDFTHQCMKKIYNDFSDPFTKEVPFLDRKLLLPKKYFFTNTIEASRGCGNQCSFCVVNSLNHGQQSFRGHSSLLYEIERMSGSILFLDSNHTQDIDRMRPLWLALKARKISWYCAGTTTFAQNKDLVRFAASCGLKGILIGMESINNSSNTEAGKSFNNTGSYREMVKILHDHDIGVLGCFVFGFDHDDKFVFEKTVRMVQESKIDIVRYSIATPLPGTKFFNSIKAQNRLTTIDWELFDTEHVVYKPKLMTEQQLYEGQIFAYRETYKHSSILERLLGKHFNLLYLAGNYQFRNVAYTFNQAHKHQETVL